MVSNEEKKNFLEKYLPICFKTQNDTEFNLKLHQLLLSDTKDGRLYKYYSFDKKGWSLKSLNSQTLHCSSPRVFNDPFECKLGMDFNSIITDMYERDFDIVGDLLCKAVEVMDGVKSLTEFNEDEQEIIHTLINGSFGAFYKEHRDTDIDENDLNKLFLDNFVVIKDIIEIIANRSKNGEQLHASMKMMETITPNMDEYGRLQLLDEKSTFADFAQSNGVVEDVDEMQLASLIYQKKFPEKVDEAKKSEAKLTEIGGKVINMLLDLFYVGCLCTDNKNRLMWSHYADNHKGFCVEYDYSSYDYKADEAIPFPVIYSTQRVKVPWKPALENTSENLNDATGKLALALLTKDSAWQYENEWRVLIKAGEPQDIKCAPITCIYLGVMCSEKNKKKIMRIAKKINVPVKQMVMDRGEYELHVQEIT